MSIFSKYNAIHFIGIGGVSMSGIAELAIRNNCSVSGSDWNLSDRTNKLVSLGCTIFKGHSSENINDNIDLVIYTSAMSTSNPEYIKAKKNKIEIMSRTQFLGKIMNEYKNRIAISGTHGKTTTTSILSHLLMKLTNPTILIGGYHNSINGNIHVGSNEFFVTEACEYKENFLDLSPNCIMMLNIEWDHPDYYTTFESFKNAFSKFSKKLSISDTLLYNNDDIECRNIAKFFDGNKISFGKDPSSSLRLVNLSQNSKSTNFSFIYNNIKYNAEISTLGIHNVYNALAALLCLANYGFDMDNLINFLKSFEMTKRRLNLVGYFKETCPVYDDYGHHPTAIKITIESLRKICKNNLWVVFEPHTYSRTKSLFNDFSNAFNQANYVLLPPIYPAREEFDPTISSKMLATALKNNNINAKDFIDFKEIIDFLKDNLEENDLLLTIGAGNVGKIAMDIVTKF